MANAADRRRRRRVIHVMRRRPQMAERVHSARCVLLLLLHRRDEMGAAAVLAGWRPKWLQGQRMLLLSFWETKEREKGTEVIGKLVNSGDDAKRKTVVPRSLARPAGRALLPDSIRSMDDGESAEKLGALGN